MPSVDVAFCQFASVEGAFSLTVAHKLSILAVSCTTPELAAGLHTVSVAVRLRRAVDHCTHVPAGLLMHTNHARLLCSQWNGLDFGSQTLHLEIVPPVVVHEISPTCGPVLGGTLLHLAGGGRRRSRLAEAHLACRVGNMTTVATLIDWTDLMCMTPAIYNSRLGFYSVEVTNVPDHFITAGVFRYAAQRATHMFPLAGPLRGGTTVTVSVYNLCGMSIVCSFGEAVAVRATRVSTSTIQCVSPPATSSRGGHTAFRVRAAGAALAPLLSFNYLPTAETFSIHPSAVADTGGTRWAQNNR